MAEETHIFSNGAFRKAEEIHVKVNNTWISCDEKWVRHDGIWRRVFKKGYPQQEIIVDTYRPANDTPIQQFNVRSELINRGWDQITPVDVIIRVTSTGVIGSYSTTVPAFTLEANWPAGSKFTLIIDSGGYIVGRGGVGGLIDYNWNPVSSTNGGPAMRINYPITIINNGVIGSGGGGRNYSQQTYNVSGVKRDYIFSGGNGAGYRFASDQRQDVVYSSRGGAPQMNPVVSRKRIYDYPILAGTLTQGTRGVNMTGAVTYNDWWRGGDLGKNADDASGKAGMAISGESNITWLVRGTVLGPTTL